jgi:hypothetical protein
MAELFDDDVAEEKELVVEDELVEDELVEIDDEIAVQELGGPSMTDARRRLENLLDDKRLRDELEDFLDY